MKPDLQAILDTIHRNNPGVRVKPKRLEGRNYLRVTSTDAKGRKRSHLQEFKAPGVLKRDIASMFTSYLQAQS